MSRSAEVRRFFGEGELTFALTIGPAEQLEELRAEAMRRRGFDPGHAGLMAIRARLADGAFLVDDVRQTLRLGLIGGGMDREEAYRLVERHLVSGYLIKAAMVAGDVLDAALSGSPEDQPGAGQSGEPKGPPAPTQPGSPTDASAGPGSSARAARSASRRRKSDAPPSGS